MYPPPPKKGFQMRSNMMNIIFIKKFVSSIKNYGPIFQHIFFDIEPNLSPAHVPAKQIMTNEVCTCINGKTNKAFK